MDHYREYQCNACDYYFSHPIDRCPICSDQFFWLVVPQQNITDTQKQGYVSQMKNLGGAGVTEEFLTYRNRLWLPYNFWEVDPGGELLARWEFIKQIKLYQHKKSSRDEDTETFSESVFDTKPAMSTQPFLDLQHPHRMGQIDKPLDLDTPKVSSGAWQSAPSVAKVPQSSAVAEPAPSEMSPILLKDWLPPVLIFVFFMLLSLSFLVMRYHKNTQSPILVTQVEAHYVYPFLS